MSSCLRKLCWPAALAASLVASPTLAEQPSSDGVTVTVNTLGSSTYPVLTQGRVVIVNAQRLVVTQEPAPLAVIDEPPPEPLAEEKHQPPHRDAVWVPGHWVYGPTGYSWVAGRYVNARPGHVFVPPRWAVLEEEYLFFTGFFVPLGVYVRSHFNKYFYSGTPNGSGRSYGPYWPVGASPTARNPYWPVGARDPYWPVGARR